MFTKQSVLVLGGSGFLGANVIYDLQNQFEVTGTYRSTHPKINIPWINFEINDLDVLSSISKPDVIVNCIGLTDVDFCESHVKESQNINAIFPRKLANMCSLLNIKLIHISTDNFESSSDQLRDEKVNAKAVNVYGETKLAGEKFVLNASPNNLVFRSNFFGYAYEGRNSLLQWIISEANSHGRINGVEDVFFNPVSVKIFSEVICESILKNYTGLYNLSSNECLSKFAFIKLVLDRLDYSKVEAVPLKLGELKLAAKRPKYMCLDNQKISRILSFPIPSLEYMIKEQLGDIIRNQSLLNMEI